jgi:hypothetical protein
MTLHRFDGSAQMSARVSKIRKRAADFALDWPANFALGWESSQDRIRVTHRGGR